MANTSLISVFEVIDKAPAGHHFDSKLLKPFLKDANYFLCEDECFGEEFYFALLNDIKDFEEYDDCKQYAINDIVVYGSEFYINLTGAAPGTSPLNPVAWAVTDKFNNADYQELYELHLCEYMTFSVLHYSVPSVAYRATTVGIMRNMTDHSESATGKEVNNLKNDWQNRRETRFMSMHKYLTRVLESQSIDNVARFPLYPPNIEDGCNDKCDPKETSINIPFPE